MAPNLMNIEEQVKHYYRYTENYDWTRATDAFVGPETVFHWTRSTEILKLVNKFTSHGRYLDVGCGTALITRRLPLGTIGIDLNPRNLQKAKHYATKARFIHCDAEGTIPLRDQSMEVAVCTETLEHLLYPQYALKEVNRVLKPKGILLGSVPGQSPIWKLRWMSKSSNSFDEEPYHKHYSRNEVEKLLIRYFSIQKLYSKFFQMNWYFIALKKENF
jgi:ubiquinone/menaquinone biosynthesis C-methylase UbiE